MQYQPIFDTALGLCFIYFAAALFASGFVEFVANLVKKRAKILLLGLRDMLSPPTQAVEASFGRRTWSALSTLARNLSKERELYAASLAAGTNPSADRAITPERILGHSLVRSLKQARADGTATRVPSYAPGDIVARALVDIVGSLPQGDVEHARGNGNQVFRIVENVPDESLRKSLATLAVAADGQMEAFLSEIEKWYDAQMDRASGAYKRWAKRWAIVAAIPVVLALHLDSFAIARTLWTDEAVRAAVVASAGNATCTPEPSPSSTATGTQADAQGPSCIQSQITRLSSSGLPIGWQQWTALPEGGLAWTEMLAGFAISVAAISMGAPFWFGAMNRLVNVRNAGNPPKEESK